MIYLDYASTTPIDSSIAEEYTRVMTHIWANPSSPHSLGREAHGILETARHSIAQTLKVPRTTIYFTPTATYSNNVIFNTFLSQGAHCITTSIEHSSISQIAVHHPHKDMITRITPNTTGVIDYTHILSAITDTTALISLHLSHNEIGVVQPIHELSTALKTINKNRKQRIYLHIDASQSPSYLPVEPDYWGVDYMTLSSHKLYAPRGAALMYVRESNRTLSTNNQINTLLPLNYGGTQERGIIAGTENVAAIHAFALALKQAYELRIPETIRVGALRDLLAHRLQDTLPITINGIFQEGNYESRIASNLHITLPQRNQESVLLLYDQQGIMISAGSACASGSITTPTALQATKSPQGAHIRISLGRYTTQDDIEAFAQATEQIYTQLA